MKTAFFPYDEVFGMSVDASLNVYIDSFDVIKILDCLIKNGFDIYSPDGNINMIISQDDSFTWGEPEITLREFYDIAERNKDLGYPVGISLWDNNEIFTNLLAVSEDKIIFSCDIGRKTFVSGDIEVTDVNYYIEKILAPLEKDFKIGGFEFKEYR